MVLSGRNAAGILRNEGGRISVLRIDLKDRVALVTGGSRGIGAGITRTLCEAGALVCFTHRGIPDHRDIVESLLSDIGKGGGWAEDAVVDALDGAAMQRLINDLVQRRGRIDILVHNVGRNLQRRVEEMTEEGWRRFIDINLTAAYHGIRAAVPHMVERRFGRIVLIGSSAAYDGGGGAIDYAAAKAGLSGMMRYLCKTYARKGINTNVVHPCVIGTDLVRERYSTEEAWRRLEAQIPVGRVGRPEDIGGMVAFLASSWGDYITGQEILLDGGRTLWRS
jgi:NAD(P)-dependent dehydrogenase (short-subunit alcohol dehydrogenase family)